MNLARRRLAPGFDAEAPGLDALLPVGAGEAVVVPQASAGEEEIVALATLLVAQAAVDDGAAERVAAPLPEFAAVAARDAHLGAGHRLAGIQGGDPDQAVVAADFQMHGEIGDQHGGAHVHGLRRGEQGSPQEPALNFDDVVAGLLQGDADHLELLAGAGFGQVAADHPGALLEEGQFPGDPGVEGLDGVLAAAALRRSRLLLEAGQSAHGGDDVGVVGETLVGEAVGRQLQAAGGQRRLDIAQGDGQDAALLQFENAKTAGELGERRQAASLHSEGKAARVGERPAGLVLHAGGDFQAQFGVLWEGLLEHHAAAGVLAVLLFVGAGRAAALGGDEADFGERGALELGGEFQAQVG